MDDAVTKRRGGNQAAFRFVDVETRVCARAIRLVAQLGLQREQIVFEVIFKRGDICVTPFAFARFAIGEQQIFPRMDLFVHQKNFCPATGSCPGDGAILYMCYAFIEHATPEQDAPFFLPRRESVNERRRVFLADWFLFHEKRERPPHETLDCC